MNAPSVAHWIYYTTDWPTWSLQWLAAAASWRRAGLVSAAFLKLYNPWRRKWPTSQQITTEMRCQWALGVKVIYAVVYGRWRCGDHNVQRVKVFVLRVITLSPRCWRRKSNLWTKLQITQIRVITLRKLKPQRKGTLMLQTWKANPIAVYVWRIYCASFLGSTP